MGKKEKAVTKRSARRIARRIVAVCLAICMTVQTGFSAAAEGGAGGGGRPGAAMGSGLAFFDGLDAFGNTTATIGCVLNVASVLANGDWDHPETVGLQLVDSIFGTSFSPDPTEEMIESIYNDVGEMKETLNDVKGSVDYLVENSKYVNQQLATINGSLATVNSKLNRQTQMLGDIKKSLVMMNDEMTASFKSLNDLIDNDCEDIKTAVYDSTEEIKKTTKLNNELTAFVNDYSKLYSVEQNILETLSNMQSDYTAFYNAIKKLDNGDQVIEVLAKLSMEENAEDKLGSADKKLLAETNVTIGGKKYNVLKYHQDFMDSLVTFVCGTGNDKSRSVYTLNGSVGNIGDSTKEMGDYLLAQNKTFNALTGDRGIGELYYLYCTFTCENSDDAHKMYRAFMDSMVAQYMTTAWLAEMVYGYKINQEAVNGNNATLIDNYEQYLYGINAQMVQVSAYYDYEYRKCINTYDYGNYKTDKKDKFKVFYGNTKNKYDWSAVSRNKITPESGLSEEDITMALGEQHRLYFFYRMCDVSAKKDMVWESSNPDVCVVDHEGNLLALSRGVATITATYNGNKALKKSCRVSVGDVMAVKNGTDKSNYYFYSYGRENMTWVAKDLCYSVDAETGYDYYYAVTTYRGDAINLSDKRRSASLIESTGLTDVNMKEFEWTVAGDQAVIKNGYEISAVDKGWSVVMGYRQDQTDHTYEYIGIPVHSTMTSILKDDSKDYSDYVKISTADDLKALAADPNKWSSKYKYVLTNDIDLGGAEWSPIGYYYVFGTRYSTDRVSLSGAFNSAWQSGTPFMGTFDGNGHTISNFKITRIPFNDRIKKECSDAFNAVKEDKQSTALCSATLGLFGVVYGGTVTDVNVEDAVIDLDMSAPFGPDGMSITKVKKDSETGAELAEDLDVTISKGIQIYAGLVAGAIEYNSLYQTYEEIQQLIIDAGINTEVDESLSEEEKKAKEEEIYNAQIALIEEHYNIPAHLSKVKETQTINNYLMTLMGYILLQASNEVETPTFSGCYAKGDIKAKFEDGNEGGLLAGLIAGSSTNGISTCTAEGSITSNGNDGALGGLVGVLYAGAGTKIADSVSKVNVTSTGKEAVGGLVGRASQDTLISFGSAFDIKEDDDPEIMMGKAGVIYLYIVLAGLFGTSVIRPGVYDASGSNVKISGNEVIANVSGNGDVGGLIGCKESLSASSIGFMRFELNETGEEKEGEKKEGEKKEGEEKESETIYSKMQTIDDLYNVDIEYNYVRGTVNAGSEGTAGGIVGRFGYKEKKSMYRDYDPEKADKDGKLNYTLSDISWGNVEGNAFFGELSGKTAAGIVGDVSHITYEDFGTKPVQDGFDFSKLKANVAGVTKVTAGQYAPMINNPGRGLGETVDDDSKAGVIIQESKFGSAAVKGGIYCSELNATGTKNDDGTTGVKASVFNDADTYTKLWGDKCYVDATGVLQEDGSLALDFKNGVFPTKLEARYRFPIDKALKVYYQGDKFKPLKEVLTYGADGTKVVTEGITSTTPDTSSVGQKTVTVKYKDYSETYDILVYPKAGYLKFSDNPKVKKDGSGLTGGKLDLYENGAVSKKGIKLSDCDVSKNDYETFVIKYGNYSTAFRPVIVCVYANDFDSNQAELLDYAYFAQGSNADVTDLVPASRKSGDVNVPLAGVSGSLKFKAENDVCLLALYYGEPVPGEDPTEDATEDAGQQGDPTAVTPEQPTTTQVTVTPDTGVDYNAADGSAVYTVKGTIKDAAGNDVVAVAYKAVSPSIGKAKTVTVPETVVLENGTTAVVTGISTGAFANAKSVQKIVLPATIESVDAGVFKGIKTLKTADLSKTKVAVLGANAFAGCTKLTTVKLPETLVEIKAGAFTNCTAMKTIIIPASVKRLGNNLFKGCKNLKSIIVKTKKLTKKTVAKKAFKGVGKKVKVTVPKKKKKAYKKLFRSKGLSKKVKIK